MPNKRDGGIRMNIFSQCNRYVRFLGQVLLFILFLHYPIYACTIFTKMAGNLVLVGNNEDWYKTNSQVMFYPASEGIYGRMFFGFDEMGLGGMNECGLCFDKCALLPERVIEFPEDKPFYEGNFWDFVLQSCATVDEAVNLIKQYNIESLNRNHVMLVDSSGNSAVIEWGPDSLAIIYKTGDYQVVTNFMLSDPNIKEPYPCWRYRKANRMLQECNVSIEHFTAILDSVHQEGNFPTQYSNIYDLKNKVVHVYHLYNYNEVVTFDLIEELKKGFHVYELPTLYTNVESLYDESPSPKQFQLFQNYPNPFNPSTTIKYNLIESSNVILKIYNLAGQELATLENGFKTASEHYINWTPKGLPGGIYFYRLRAGIYSETRKLILQK